MTKPKIPESRLKIFREFLDGLTPDELKWLRSSINGRLSKRRDMGKGGEGQRKAQEGRKK